LHYTTDPKFLTFYAELLTSTEPQVFFKPVMLGLTFNIYAQGFPLFIAFSSAICTKYNFSRNFRETCIQAPKSTLSDTSDIHQAVLVP
jgi:hypothetical protein